MKDSEKCVGRIAVAARLSVFFFLLVFSEEVLCASWLTFTPSQLFGDTTTSVKVCVTDDFGSPLKNVTFTGGVYFYGVYNSSVPHGATIGGQPATNTFAQIGGKTDTTGCLTISQIVTWGMPPTSDFTPLSSVYAELTLSASVYVPSGYTVRMAVRDFTYSVAYATHVPPLTPYPAAITSDGQYTVIVTASAQGSSNLSGNYLNGTCTSQTAPSLSPATQDVQLNSNNQAQFALNVSSTLISDPSGSSPSTSGSCKYSIWLPAKTGVNRIPVTVNGTNTCLLGLSPGDPRCGPAN